MSDAIVLLGILIVPLLAGRLISSYWVAVALSAALLSILLHVASWISLGYIAPFANISVPVSLVAFFIWAMGLIWIIRRPPKKKQ